MNPLEILNNDCVSELLKYLSVRDLLNCTRVSQQWNRIIGASRETMARVWLRFYEPIENLEALMRSNRQYCCCKIQHGVREELMPIFNKFKWRHVMLRDEENANYEKLVEFLTNLSLTIESLDLWDISSTTSNELIKIDFPRLKKLEINLTNRAIFTLFLGCNPKLKTVIIRDESAKYSENARNELMSPTNLIHEFLKINKIESLTLLYCLWAFEHDLTEGFSNRAHMRELTVTLHSTGLNFSSVAYDNVKKFISLKKVERSTVDSEQSLYKNITVKYCD